MMKRTVLRLLVPTLEWRKFMIAGTAGSWSSLARTSAMRWPRVKRRCVGHERDSVLDVLASRHRSYGVILIYRRSWCAVRARDRRPHRPSDGVSADTGMGDAATGPHPGAPRKAPVL